MKNNLKFNLQVSPYRLVINYFAILWRKTLHIPGVSLKFVDNADFNKTNTL